MDLIDKLRELSSRIPKLREQGVIKTEEGTKNALVMPFINALGYDVFNPLEVTPELVADFGTKQGEKVDYAILKDSKPIILFECKALGTNLQEVHASQLYRYFSVTSARFSILTDGVIYRFHTDLDQPNKMDKNPFFVFDLAEVNESQVEELKKFSKSAFNEDAILAAASELKYKGLIRTYLNEQFQNPKDDLIKLLMQGSGAFTGPFTQVRLDSFRLTVRDSLRLFVNEHVDNRLKSALANEQVEAQLPISSHANGQSEPQITAIKSSVMTTDDEQNAYFIIKSILRENIDVQRITMRDAQSYCAILLDDNNRRPLARIYFTSTKRSIGIFNVRREEQRYAIETLDDIYKYATQLKDAVSRYLQEPAVKEQG